MEEIWRDIVDYEGLYQVSNLGNVKSVDRQIKTIEGFLKKIEGKFIKFTCNNYGYLYVDLYKYNKKHRFYIHRLVAETFLENPKNKPFVNHIDCNPLNNKVDNLEWCTQKENIQYANKLGRMKSIENLKKVDRNKLIQKCSKPVIATNIQTGEEIYFSSINEACRQLNLHNSNIQKVLKGNRKQTGGYTFKYLKED